MATVELHVRWSEWRNLPIEAPQDPSLHVITHRVVMMHVRAKIGRVHFVVVFNLTRFARNKYDHFALRSHLQSLGISLRSAPYFPQMEPTDQLDAPNRRLPESRVGRVC